MLVFRVVKHARVVVVTQRRWLSANLSYKCVLPVSQIVYWVTVKRYIIHNAAES